MPYELDYDVVLGCFIMHYKGESICLGSDLLSDAVEEANSIVEAGV